MLRCCLCHCIDITAAMTLTSNLTLDETGLTLKQAFKTWGPFAWSDVVSAAAVKTGPQNNRDTVGIKLAPSVEKSRKPPLAGHQQWAECDLILEPGFTGWDLQGLAHQQFADQLLAMAQQYRQAGGAPGQASASYTPPVLATVP